MSGSEFRFRVLTGCSSYLGNPVFSGIWFKVARLCASKFSGWKLVPDLIYDTRLMRCLL